MSRKYLIILGTGIVLVTFGLLVLTFDNLDPLSFATPAKEMIPEAVEEGPLLSPGELQEMLRTEAEIRIIDLRDPESFQAYRMEEAINIPLERILDEDQRGIFAVEGKKVLVDQNGLKANQAWMLLSQYGFTEIYLLEGGMEQWSREGSTSFQDEKQKIDFKATMGR